MNLAMCTNGTIYVPNGGNNNSGVAVLAARPAPKARRSNWRHAYVACCRCGFALVLVDNAVSVL